MYPAAVHRQALVAEPQPHSGVQRLCVVRPQAQDQPAGYQCAASRLALPIVQALRSVDETAASDAQTCLDRDACFDQHAPGICLAVLVQLHVH